MRLLSFLLLLFAIGCGETSQDREGKRRLQPDMRVIQDEVKIVTDKDGSRLVVNGKDFMINGMNWDYFPIGTNYSYNLWVQPDSVIKDALDTEMSMLNDIGVNAIRQYTGIPTDWIEYIYENYGIYTMLNHSFGRYGLTIDKEWIAKTDYSDPKVHEILLEEVKQLVYDYNGTRGLLMFLIGNENNYGLTWEGAETEDIPVENMESAEQATSLYKLFNEAAVAMKNISNSVPVAICNGDLVHLDIIAEECRDIDILGVNIYRGISFGDSFRRVRDDFGKPLMLTEFGSDAYDSVKDTEDQSSQAYYLLNNWQEIYENAAGLGEAENCIGGFTFQFSDGWWKTGQTINLDIQDNTASWANGGYLFDYVPGKNNMNEEWFGICAKVPGKGELSYQLLPRVAYYTLMEAHKIDPYREGTTQNTIRSHFSEIDLAEMEERANKVNSKLIQPGK